MEMVDILLGLSWCLSLLFAFASGSLTGAATVAKRQQAVVGEIIKGIQSLFKKEVKENA